MGSMDGFSWYLAGFVVQVMCFGVALSQAFNYFIRNRDSWPWRLFTTVLILLNIAAVALVSDSIDFYLIENFGNLNAIDSWPASLAWFNIVQGMMGTMSQLFFAFQIYQFSRGAKIISSVIVMQALSSFALNVYIHFSNAPIPALVRIAGSLSVGLATLGDVTATITMCVYLRSMRQGASTKRVHAIINRIILVVINRGVLVTVAESTLLFFVLFSQSRFQWGCIWLIVPGLYVNTTLSMLNSRVATQTKLEASSSSTLLTCAQEPESSQSLPSFVDISGPIPDPRSRAVGSDGYELNPSTLHASYRSGSNLSWDTGLRVTTNTTITL